MSFAFKEKTLTGTTDGDGDLTFLINKETLGYDPGHLYAQHQIQMVDGTGTPTFSVVMLGPGGRGVTLATAIAESSVFTCGPNGIGHVGAATLGTMAVNIGSIYLRSSVWQIVIADGGATNEQSVSFRSDAVAF